MKKYDDRLVPARDIRPSGALAETTIGIGLEGVSVRSAIRSFPGQVVTLARAVKCGQIVALLTARPDSRLRVAPGGEGLFEFFGIVSASDPGGRAGTWRCDDSAGQQSSEEQHVGNSCVRTCRFRRPSYHINKQRH